MTPPGPALPDLPELRVVPEQLSAEHHLLRRLNDQQPSTLGQVLGAILRRYPDYAALGRSPEHPSESARNAWARIAAERWTRAAPVTMGRGLLLTGAGELRLAELWRHQVVAPWIRGIEHTHGREVAERVLRGLP